MTNYRLYRLDGAGKFISAEWLEADDDEHALSQALERAPDGTFELWQRNRLVSGNGKNGYPAAPAE